MQYQRVLDIVTDKAAEYMMLDHPFDLMETESGIQSRVQNAAICLREDLHRLMAGHESFDKKRATVLVSAVCGRLQARLKEADHDGDTLVARFYADTLILIVESLLVADAAEV